MQTSIYFPLFTSVTSVGDAHATRARFLRRRPAGSSSEKNYSALVTVYLSVVMRNASHYGNLENIFPFLTTEDKYRLQTLAVIFATNISLLL